MSISHDQIVRVLMRERVRLLAFIQVLVFDAHAAEDVLQDISALAINKSDEINSEQHLLLWLRKAARYKAMNLNSKRKNQPLLFNSEVLDLIEADWSVHENVSSSEAMQALERCIEKLSPYSQTLIKSRYREGNTGDKLAESVGRKVGSVYVQLSRIHKQLAGCVRKQMEGGVPNA